MDFRIADTFTDSLARLTGEEQKAVKTTAFDLQINPANPGLSFHRLDDARDKNFWSVRASGDILHVNYRTSHQIRTQADRLLGPAVSDVDGNAEDRRGTASAFNGPQPSVSVFNNPEEEISAVGVWIGDRIRQGIIPHEIGVFVRSAVEFERAREAVTESGLPFKMLDEHMETSHGHLCVATMHLAKGLEFRAVVVMACDDEIIPLQTRIETVTDDSDLEEVYNTESHSLYVACTRARDHLLVCGVEPASEFLDDLRTPGLSYQQR